MRTPTTVRGLEEFSRVRLSRSFFMRDFLYSDIPTCRPTRIWRLPPAGAFAKSSSNRCKRHSAGWRSVRLTARKR